MHSINLTASQKVFESVEEQLFLVISLWQRIVLAFQRLKSGNRLIKMTKICPLKPWVAHPVRNNLYFPFSLHSFLSYATSYSLWLVSCLTPMPVLIRSSQLKCHLQPPNPLCRQLSKQVGKKTTLASCQYKFLPFLPLVSISKTYCIFTTLLLLTIK